MTHTTGTSQGHKLEVKLDAEGNLGTFTYTQPTGITSGDLEVKYPSTPSLRDQFKAFRKQEVIPTGRKAVWVALPALLIPAAVVVGVPFLHDPWSGWANLLLAGAAAFVGVAVALSKISTAPHVVFGLTLFSAWSAVLLVLAKAFGLPGS